MERTKDAMLSPYSVSVGTSNAKGFDKSAGPAGRLELRLRPADVATLISALTALAGTETGVKLDIHYGKRTTKDGARLFDTAFFFVKEVQKEGAAYAGGAAKPTVFKAVGAVEAPESFTKKGIVG